MKTKKKSDPEAQNAEDEPLKVHTKYGIQVHTKKTIGGSNSLKWTQSKQKALSVNKAENGLSTLEVS